MKKKFFIGMLSILLILGLVMTGCSLDDPKGGSNSGGGSGPGGSSNPFAGTSWRATDDGITYTLSFTSSSWSLSAAGDTIGGSYTYSGNTATCK